MAKAKFELGQVVMTQGAEAAFAKTEQSPMTFVARHMDADWGEMPPSDAEMNQRSLEEGGGFHSAYRLHDGTRIWIITEPDRSVTTLLLPEDY